MDGKVVLANLVIGALVIYSMQATLLPIENYNILERLQRNFLWGHETEEQKIHNVSQQKIYLLKNYAGLGFKNLRDMNAPCILKLAWKINETSFQLWIKILKGKYGKNCN